MGRTFSGSWLRMLTYTWQKSPTDQNVDEYVDGSISGNYSELSSLSVLTQIPSAILHAYNEWDVDLISMSFGFPCMIEDLRQAIEETKHHVLLFAAASNDGVARWHAGGALGDG
ncbi:hypothetical protein ACQKWADRAFT_66894 [Trichoderma austrokoningii]